MSGDPQERLKNFKPKKKFFVGIDSDGCAFDTMELKQKECFIPNIVLHFEQQSVSKYLRETAEFVNLYSKWRGTNRFPALNKTFELLAERPEVRARNAKLPDFAPLRQWIASETRLGNPTLEAHVKVNPDPMLQLALKWSLAVNRAVTELVHGVAPFPGVRESLEKLSSQADIIVVSATPNEALVREWAEHGIDEFAEIIAGQEMGTKKEHLQLAAQGKYEDNCVLMVGDAPGDLRAANAIGALFYPINPGHEEASWRRFLDEGMQKFLSGAYSGDYQQALLDEFDGYLPETPPWKT